MAASLCQKGIAPVKFLEILSAFSEDYSSARWSYGFGEDELLEAQCGACPPQ